MRSTFLNCGVLGLTAILGLSTVAFAQAPRQGNPGSGGPSTPSPNVPGRGSPTPSVPDRTTPGQPRQPTQQLPYPEMPRPIFLSGKVVMEDGTPPPDSVAIERVCNGIVRREQFTDSKGRFSFQLGQNNYMFTDASTSGGFDPVTGGAPGSPNMDMPGRNMGGVRERDLAGCEIRASLAGFRSDVVSLATRRSLDNPDVGTIVLHRLGNVEGLTISATTLAAPKDARKEFEKGRKEAQKQKFDEAQKHLQKAVELYPKYAVAWYELGRVRQAANRLGSAREAFDEAMKADPKFISPYENLAQLAAHDKKWDEVADITDKMIRLNPVDFPNAYFMNAVANLNLQRLDAAEKSASYLVSKDASHKMVRANYVLGLVLAQKQDWNGAATQLRSYIEHAPPGTDLEIPKKQLAQVEQFLAGSGSQPKPQK
jgi:TolA-binding protein